MEMSGIQLSSTSSPGPLVLPGVDFFEVLQHHHGTSVAKMPSAVPWDFHGFLFFEAFCKQNFRYPKTESSKWTCSIPSCDKSRGRNDQTKMTLNS